MINKKQRIGQYFQSSVGAGKSYQAYLPPPLPPQPALDIGSLYMLLDQASTALGRLDGMGRLLPNRSLYIRQYVRREAIFSSQIEGIKTSLSELFMFENNVPSVPSDDVLETACCITATDYALRRLSELPLSLRLMKEAHQKLMDSTRGRSKYPGEFRTTQNWIGGRRIEDAVFVPPPPNRVMECMGELEKFLHDDAVQLPALIKVALVHCQFETIHPFVDGNGRIGRLLITLMLRVEGILSEPLLCPSWYFKVHRQAYYDYLEHVRKTGDWESWIKFFLTGIADTAQRTAQAIEDTLRLFEQDSRKIKESGKSTSGVLAVYKQLQECPVYRVATLRERTGLAHPTVLRSLAVLEALGIVKEITGKARHKVFSYRAYLDILGQDTSPFDDHLGII